MAHVVAYVLMNVVILAVGFLGTGLVWGLSR